MQFLGFVLAALLVQICRCNKPLPMELWAGSELQSLPVRGDTWTTAPTWWAVYPLKSVYPDKTAADVADYDVIEVAGLMYQWLVSKYPKMELRSTSEGMCLVAVIWDPVAQEFTGSTIPVGPRKIDMIKLAAQQSPSSPAVAPAWYNQVRRLIDATRNTAFFHAEDGAFFHWETRNGPHRVANGKYTGNLVVGVWGKRTWHDGNHNDLADGPRIWNLCGAKKVRDPSCTEVAKGLGIARWIQRSHRRRDVNIVDNENLADFDGRTPTLADIAAAKIVEVACGVSNAKRELRSGRNQSACNSYINPSMPSATPNPEAVMSSKSTIPAITAAPSSKTKSTEESHFTCSMQKQDPDQGINTQYCVCKSSMTLPLLSIASTARATEACHYTTIPSSRPATTIATGFHSTTTNSALCEVCREVVNNEDSCTTISGCLPQAAKASVTVATSPLHVGTLTGDTLYTSVSNALMSVCPPVTQTTSATKCSGTAKVKDITYVEGESIAHDGELEVFAAFSSYNQTSLRDAMIKSLAQSAAKSATGKNCYKAPYTVLMKRDETGPRSWYDFLFRSDRTLAVRDRPVPEHEEIELCNMAELAEVNYYSQFWRLAPQPGATDYIEAQYKFHVTNGGFMCEFLELLTDGLAVVAPEFAVADVELGEAMTAICQGLAGET